MASGASAPFSRVFVPYDGSEPARAALKSALAIARHGVQLVIATVVDETALIVDSASTMVAYDPTPIMDELDAQGRSLLDEATAQCGAAGVSPVVQIVHDRPVSGILSSSEQHGSDLIVMGTHARSGVARTFLGSTTAGVLRLSRVPVLTVRAVDRTEAAPFASVLLALDDSEPADAAADVAARLRVAGASVTACYVVDTAPLYENASNFGFDPEPLAIEMRDGGAAVIHAALARAGLAADTPVALLEGEPAGAIVAAAKDRRATLIICGTHGRRGLRRFLLGSVAEHLVRTSEVPVLVVPSSHRKPQL